MPAKPRSGLLGFAAREAIAAAGTAPAFTRPGSLSGPRGGGPPSSRVLTDFSTGPNRASNKRRRDLGGALRAALRGRHAPALERRQPDPAVFRLHPLDPPGEYAADVPDERQRQRDDLVRREQHVPDRGDEHAGGRAH